MLSVGNKYRMRDLLCDVLTRKLEICVTYKVNDVSAVSDISSPYQPVNSFPEPRFRWRFSKFVLDFSILSMFLV